MILYTIHRPQDPTEQTIIGIRKGENNYGLNRLHDSPDCIIELLHLGFIKHIYCTYPKNHLFAELILNEEAQSDSVTLKTIDLDGDISDVEEEFINTYCNLFEGSISLSSVLAFPYVKGNTEATKQYEELAIASSCDFIRVAEVEGAQIVTQFRRMGRTYTCIDIATSSEAVEELHRLMKKPLTARAVSINNSLAVFVKADIDAFNYAVIQHQDITSDYFERFLSYGFKTVNDRLVEYPKFDSIEGEPAALQEYKAFTLPRVYTRTLGDKQYFYAACIDGVYISVKDLIRIPYTRDTITRLLNVESLIIEFMESDRASILLPKTALESSSVTFQDISQASIPDVVLEHLEQEYKQVTEQGLTYPAVTDKITYPTLEDFSLASFTLQRGDPDSCTRYNTAYDWYNPNLCNMIQPVPTAPVSFALPTYNQIKPIFAKKTVSSLAEEDIESSTEALENSTSFFSEKQKELVQYHSYDELGIPIDTNHIRVDSVFEYYDCKNYRNVLAMMNSSKSPELIGGFPSNNTLGIQQNELALFIGLRNLVLYGLCDEYGLYTIEQLSNALTDSMHSTIVDEFIHSMVEDAYSLNWKHTGHVVVSRVTYSSSEEETDEEATLTIPGYYEVERDGNSYKVRETMLGLDQILQIPNGLLKIDQFVEKNIVNSFAWIEILIKMLRWGERKPTALCAYSRAPITHYFNMQTLATSTHSGNVNDLEPMEFDGCTSFVSGAVVLNFEDEVAANDLAAHLGVSHINIGKYPIGVILASTNKNCYVTTYRYIDIFTLASDISQGTLKVYGITYDKNEGKFHCANNLEVVESFTDSKGEHQDTFSYDVEERFSEAPEEVAYAVGRLSSTEGEYITLAKCQFLAKYLKVLADKLSNFKAYEVSILRILNRCTMSIDWDQIAEFEQVLSIDSPADRSTYLNSLRMRLNIRDNNTQLENIIFRTALKPFLDLIAQMQTMPTLADLLAMALNILHSMNSSNSSVVSTGDTSSSIRNLIKSCKTLYSVDDLEGRKRICYLAPVTINGTQKILMFKPDEVDFELSGTIIPLGFKTFLSDYIRKIPVKVPAEMKSALSKNFVLSSYKVFIDIYNECLAIVKQSRK